MGPIVYWKGFGREALRIRIGFWGILEPNLAPQNRIKAGTHTPQNKEGNLSYHSTEIIW